MKTWDDSWDDEEFWDDLWWVPFNELICAVATPIHRFIKFRHLEIVEEISPKTC